MQRRVDQLQLVQVLYEISMSIGGSMDLQTMLRTSLSTILKKLNCAAGGVYFHQEEGATRFEFQEIYTIPRNPRRNQAYQTAQQQLPANLTAIALESFYESLPISGHSQTDQFYYLLPLPELGVLILVKNGQDLAPTIIKSLHPLLVKLSSACRGNITQQALRSSQERFRQVVASISPHVYVTEIKPDGKLANRYISPNITTLTGYPLKNFLSDWSFWPSVVIHPEDRQFAAEQLQALVQGQNSEVEYRLVRADGSHIWVRDSGRVAQETLSDQTSLMIYGAVSDITDSKEAAAAMARAHDQALEASRLKSQLLANVSHDMRTPLNAILGYAEMLKEGVYGPLTDKQIKPTAEIIDSTGQLLNFITNLLNQAQIESGRLTPKLVALSPAKLLKNTWPLFNSLAQSKGLTLTNNIKPDVPAQLQGDPYWLRQILTNLVSNAIKFTQQGNVDVTIFRPDKHRWAIMVTDSGVGIPADIQAAIFDAFYQGNNGHKDQLYTGTGLGLSIVERLVTLMNGEITLTSEVGSGSIFTIYLPLKPVPEQTL